MTKRKSDRRRLSAGRPVHDNSPLLIHAAALALANGKSINAICNDMWLWDLRLSEDGVEGDPVPVRTIKRRFYTARDKLLTQHPLPAIYRQEHPHSFGPNLDREIELHADELRKHIKELREGAYYRTTNRS